MAGELQLGGSTVASHTGSGASAVVTIDNGVKFPAGTVIGYQRDANNNVQTLTGNYPNNAQPTSSGGNLVCSVTHTAKANSKILLYAIIYASESANTGDQIAIAFFKDTTADSG